LQFSILVNILKTRKGLVIYHKAPPDNTGNNSNCITACMGFPVGYSCN